MRTIEEQVKEAIDFLKKGWTLCYGYATEELANKGGDKGLSCYRNNVVFCYQNDAEVFKQIQAQVKLRKLRIKKELAPFKVELYKLEKSSNTEQTGEDKNANK